MKRQRGEELLEKDPASLSASETAELERALDLFPDLELEKNLRDHSWDDAAEPDDAALLASMAATAAPLVPTGGSGAGGGSGGLGSAKLAAIGLTLAGLAAIVLFNRSNADSEPPKEQPAAVRVTTPQQTPPPATDLEEPGDGQTPAGDVLLSAANTAPTLSQRAAQDVQATPAKPSKSAAQLLEAANAARGAGENKKSAGLYRELRRLYPKSREAQTATVSLAKLELKALGRPKRALKLFQAYLNTSPNGTLAEEAVAGTARSHQALGHDEREREAWLSLRSRFPNSVHTTQAKKRLAALSERPAD